MLTGRAAAALAAAAGLAAVLTACADTDSGSAVPDPATGPDSASDTTAAATAPVPAGPADVAEIEAVTRTFVTGDNNGDVAMLERALCRSTAEQMGLAALGPNPRPQMLFSVTDVQMLGGSGGDEALATVSLGYVDEPGAAPATAALSYLREDGRWTVCTR